MKRLNEMFDEWFTGNGIFGALALVGAPWGSANALQLDHAYHGNHSGMKCVSPMLAYYERVNEGGPLTAGQRDSLARTLLAIYGENWEKLYETLSYEYNPIENYDMVEEETPAETTVTRTPAETTVTTTPAETTVTNTPEETTRTTTPAETTETRTEAGYTESKTTDTSKYGFNEATNPAPTDKVEETTTKTPGTAESLVKTTNTAESETTETDSPGTVATTVDNPETVVTKSDNPETVEYTTQANRTLTRHGNIGVTTSQQMIQSERELWFWNFIQDRVFPDIDKYLTIPIY